LYQLPWSQNSNFIVLNDHNSNFIINLKENKIFKTIRGSNVMWMQGYEKILYFKNDTELYSLDIKLNRETMIFKIKDNLFSKIEVLDYYWFSEQKIIYIKLRCTNKFIDYYWYNDELTIKEIENFN
jgi:hypothetical protein